MWVQLNGPNDFSWTVKKTKSGADFGFIEYFFALSNDYVISIDYVIFVWFMLTTSYAAYFMPSLVITYCS